VRVEYASLGHADDDASDRLNRGDVDDRLRGLVEGGERELGDLQRQLGPDWSRDRRTVVFERRPRALGLAAPGR
jgi:hypothetical protein